MAGRVCRDLAPNPRQEAWRHARRLYPACHQPDGQAIQLLYVGHVDTYVDYSHGIRLMSGRMLVDGQERNVSDVLADPLLCGMLGSEGPLDPQVLPTLREKIPSP